GERSWQKFSPSIKNCAGSGPNSNFVSKSKWICLISKRKWRNTRSTSGGNRRSAIKEKAMLQLIRADLIGILTLFADYRPQLDADSLALDIRKLGRMEDRDYLFLARREKSYLFPISEVYLAES